LGRWRAVPLPFSPFAGIALAPQLPRRAYCAPCFAPCVSRPQNGGIGSSRFCPSSLVVHFRFWVTCRFATCSKQGKVSMIFFPCIGLSVTLLRVIRFSLCVSFPSSDRNASGLLRSYPLVFLSPESCCLPDLVRMELSPFRARSRFFLLSLVRYSDWWERAPAPVWRNYVWSCRPKFPGVTSNV